MMNKILKQVQKSLLPGIGIAFFGSIAFVADLSAAEAAHEEPQVQRSELSQTMPSAARQSEDYWALSRPYSEYLLHQQDFTFQEGTRELKTDFPVYSGAPMLSNYNASYFEAMPMSTPGGAQTRLIRLASGAALLVLFSLPFIVLFKKMSEPEKARKMRVFPIFTIRSGEYAPRELFAMTFSGGRMIHHAGH